MPLSREAGYGDFPKTLLFFHYLKDRISFFEKYLKSYPSSGAPSSQELDKLFRIVLKEAMN